MFDTIGAGRKPFWCYRQPNPTLYLVKDNIVFQGVGAHDVVVIWISISPDDSRRLIDAAVHRLEGDAHLAVSDAPRIPNRQRKTAGGAISGHLGENVSRGGSRSVPNDLPLRGRSI